MLKVTHSRLVLMLAWTMLAAGCFDLGKAGQPVVPVAASPGSTFPMSRRIQPPSPTPSAPSQLRPTEAPVFVPWPTPTPRTLLGVVSTLAGPNPEEGQPFNFPNALTVDPDGYVYVSDTYTFQARTVRIMRVAPDGTVSILAGFHPGYTDADWMEAEFSYTTGVALDSARNVYVADQGNNCVRKITPLGEVSTLAGGISGWVDGKGAVACFKAPTGVAVDCLDNVYVADQGNHCIRKISPDGEVTTLAGGEQGYADGIGASAKFNSPYGIAVDASGMLYVTDQYNDCIRKIAQDGRVTTLAGGALQGSGDGVGPEAQFYRPYGIAVDPFGVVFVADGGKLRRITQGGAVTTLSYDSLGTLIGVAVDARGLVYTVGGKRVQFIE